MLTKMLQFLFALIIALMVIGGTVALTHYITDKSYRPISTINGH